MICDVRRSLFVVGCGLCVVWCLVGRLLCDVVMCCVLFNRLLLRVVLVVVGCVLRVAFCICVR